MLGFLEVGVVGGYGFFTVGVSDNADSDFALKVSETSSEKKRE